MTGESTAAAFWRGRQVVVTGGSGLLGTHVVRRLRTLDCAGVYVARSRDYDLTRQDAAEQLFRDRPAGVVFHLAGYVGGIAANKAAPGDFFYRNLMMGANVLHQARSAGAAKVVAASTGCGYPEHAPLPIRETDYWNGYPQDESAPYSLAKRMLHVQSIAYWRQYRFPIVVTLPGNVYGPHDNFDLEAAHVVPALVRKFVEAADDGLPSVTVWGTGAPQRDFVFVGDVAQGMIRAAERCDRPALLNLSAGVGVSIRQVAELLREITGYAGAITWDRNRPAGQARRVFDVSRARKEIGFAPATPLRSGLEQTVQWYRRHRATARNEAAGYRRPLD